MKKIGSIFYYLFQYPYYKLIFGHVGRRTRIRKILKLDCPRNIFLGNHVSVNKFVWLAANPLTSTKRPKLIIGDGTYIGNFNHIYATSKIEIGKNVMTADKVYISDNLHGYEDVSLPISKQPIVQLQEVNIGDGAWIGENVCIVGASVGKGAVVGANSVVTQDVPDYCVVSGSPARIIRKYNPQTGKW